MDFFGSFERTHHLRKKFDCAGCEINGSAKPEMAIDKGTAGQGLLVHIATNNFAN